MIQIIIIVIYSLALLTIFLYSLAQLNLLVNYIKATRNIDNAATFNFTNLSEIPFVTVQLPLYNELYVVERLLENIANLDYPSDRLEIQVLDDSTDESLQTTLNLVLKLQKTGLNILHITRKDRQGFKAGALKEGLATAKGEFIAIFDSDFLPTSDWLKNTIPYFKDEKIGVVQTRWAHLNRDYSILTKIQAFALDFHFILEQVGRNFGKHFINFNGTAGVWRKTCILDAGNWQGDTLTEDLDLSYRAQLKNWKFKYLENVETPAELPIVISAARSQQFRWNKGAAENFQKLYGRLLKDPKVSFLTKFHSFFHLLNSSMFILILLVGVLSVPLLYIKYDNPQFNWIFNILALFTISTVIFFVCYWVTYKKIHGGKPMDFLRFLKMFITFFSIAMGFSLHNSIAVMEGHLGKKSAFIRTPKFNIEAAGKKLKSNIYLSHKLSSTMIWEGILSLFFGFAIYSAFVVQDYSLLPFHLMLFFGFGFVSFKSIFNEK